MTENNQCALDHCEAKVNLEKSFVVGASSDVRIRQRGI
jgi:hypothetical protein